MKTGFCIVMLFVLWLNVSGQSDSVSLRDIHPEYDFLYRELFSFDPASTFGGLMPDLSFLNKNLRGHEITKFRPLLFHDQLTIRPALLFGCDYTSVFPFARALSLQHGAVYSLSGKLKLIGTSFSGHSIHSLFPATPSLQNMDLKGASMLLEYKISKNFRIGGGVRVSNY